MHFIYILDIIEIIHKYELLFTLSNTWYLQAYESKTIRLTITIV